ncbi:hypothetical protein [Sphingopyxis flava]|uniref:Peptidase family M48 n=1 Tax=Sphingopyxis flava TaxID=1507287 RepID=A0A1T5AKT9_9SPHN|nr:hypothetical protein [Sphingopyxis flava]SKB35588.1 hypothetical protein SAMN06295937_10041 [Sphingopyxis flava]
MVGKENDVARHLWSQMFERSAGHPGAAVVDPAYDPSEDQARARAAFAAAGWNHEQIHALRAATDAHQAAAPVTSPGVNPSAEAFHAALCDEIEAEMARQGMTSQQQVARGIEPRTGPFASKVGVIMTEESIITTGAFTYRFCGLIAKAFYRTVMLNAWYWQSDSYTREKSNFLLRRNMDLALYWNKIFMSFAMSGTNATVPFEPSDPVDVVLVEQIARAMELFIVGHEYGHHHLRHGRNIAADPRVEEFAADQFALRIGRPIGERERRPIWNPYLVSGAGGVILLKALELTRVYERALGGRMAGGDTHPSAEERIGRFDSVGVMKPKEFVMLKGFRTTSARIMDDVSALMSDFLDAMPKDVWAELIAMRRRLWEELPQG